MQTLLGKPLPHGATIGELWEVVDREEAQSVVHFGTLKGKTLHQLWTHHREEVFGKLHRDNPSPRFPLLLKLLDARERLSVQVHPPASLAAELGGEAKTECWYILHASEGSSIYAGLRKGVTREQFVRALENGTVEETLHRVPCRTGESIFIPSGRIHAIGEGVMIVEIQQNSDTTFRVFDWNRAGINGKPRDLHIRESLASMDFGDFEPGMTPSTRNLIADCPHFHVEKIDMQTPFPAKDEGDFCLITCLTGEVECSGVHLKPGGFLLVPASLKNATLIPLSSATSVLRTLLPAA